MKQPCNIIGPQVRVSRESAGLTQEQLATRCRRQGFDITDEILARIEAQLHPVADGELFLLSRALDVSIATFFPSANEVKRLMGLRKTKRN